MRLSISEILNKATSIKSNEEKIAWLKKNDSVPLRTVLRLMYDETITFLLPNTRPPWKKNSYIGVEGMLFKEARRLRIFVKGCGYDDLNQTKREGLFISLLEDIDNNDAELLCMMIERKKISGITKKIVEEAYPNIFKEKIGN